MKRAMGLSFTKVVSTSVLTSARFVTGIVVILGFALAGRARLRAVNRWWLVARGLIGASSRPSC